MLKIVAEETAVGNKRRNITQQEGINTYALGETIYQQLSSNTERSSFLTHKFTT
jgi:hypothetical protein